MIRKNSQGGQGSSFKERSDRGNFQSEKRDGESRSYRKVSSSDRNGSEKPRRKRISTGRSGFGENSENRSYGSRTFSKNGEERRFRPSRNSGSRNVFRRERPVQEKKEIPAFLQKDENDGIRLNKFIANSGICSRREADEYIKAGLVSVNGTIVTEMGVKVMPGDDVRFNGERLKGEEKVYILMNKPKDVVTTTSDPHAERTVLDLIRDRCSSRIYPVGRLDKATTGVLLLTNDGDLAERLMHPSFEKKKIYHVFLDKNLKYPDLEKLLNGITLSDGPVNADAISYVDGDHSQVGIEIHSGKNRVIRRMFEYLGYKVKKLDRVYFAGLTKKNLRRGEWRFLTEQEINMLKLGLFE